jgi:hypothetical protein
MHKNGTKFNETLNKWCKNKHGASKIMDTLETYQSPRAAESICIGLLDSEAVVRLFIRAQRDTHIYLHQAAGDAFIKFHV